MAKKRPTTKKPARAGDATAGDFLPRGYAELLSQLKDAFARELRASVAVSHEMVILYWQIGRDFLDRQEHEGWGTKVIDRLAADLHRSFSEMTGLSPRNLKYMRAFGKAWPDEAIVQQAAAEIPWFHDCVLLDKVKDQNERLWYIGKTIENGWSRSVLEHWIESDLYQRQGKAKTNFDKTLPPLESDLARETLKDPYKFEFITLAGDAEERALQKGLLEHIHGSSALLMRKPPILPADS